MVTHSLCYMYTLCCQTETLFQYSGPSLQWRYWFPNILMLNWICCCKEYTFWTKEPFWTYQNDIMKSFVVVMSAVVKRIDCNTNQLLQLCTVRTAWSESDQAVRTVHSCNSWWLGPLLSDSVIKLVSVLFGKCTTLVATKCWPMETRLPRGDQWKAEKLGVFRRWPITRCFFKSDRAGLFIEHTINFRLTANIDGPCNTVRCIWKCGVVFFEFYFPSNFLFNLFEDAYKYLDI